MEQHNPQYSSASFLPFFNLSTNELNAQLSSNKKRKKFKKGNKARSISKIPCTTQVIPWKKRDCYSCGVIGLHEEIMDFYEKMRPTEQEMEIRLKVIEHVTNIVHALWPHAEVEVFGSFRTGLYLPYSDIDIVVIGEWRNLPLSTLSKALQLRGISKSDISIIENAKVPIIKFVHSPTKVKVDISFNQENGVESAKLVKKMIKQYPTLPKILLVLKQYLVQRGLNEVYNGGMSSYCLTLLLVSFLQGYHKPRTLPSINLGTMLMEFFELYGVNFNYERVSIHFDQGGNYQPKQSRAGTILNIEDPLEKGNNVAKGTFLMHLLKISFENSFHVLHRAVTESAVSQRPLNSYLSLIVNVDDSVWFERNWISQNYSYVLSQLSNLIRMLENNQGQEETANTNFNQRLKKNKRR